jgi:hypothetical protein
LKLPTLTGQAQIGTGFPAAVNQPQYRRRIDAFPEVEVKTGVTLWFHFHREVYTRVWCF